MCTPGCGGRQCGPDGCGDTCGPGCGNGELCSNGICTREGCAQDLFECGDRCADLRTDPDHCGNCGQACPRGAEQSAFPLCSDGQCFLKCGDGPNGPVVPDFNTDPNHCGACNNRCPGALGGQASCFRGACQIPCDDGYLVCNDQCIWQNRNGMDNCRDDAACCPLAAEGPVAVPALARGAGYGVRVVLDRRRHLEARLRFADSNCPALDTFGLDLMARSTSGDRVMLVHGRSAVGADDACAVLVADLEAGVYNLRAESLTAALPAATVTWATSAAPASTPRPATINAPGVYSIAAARFEEVNVALRLAQPSRLRLRYLPEGSVPTEACTSTLLLTSQVNPGGQAFDFATCTEVDELMPAGEYTAVLHNGAPVQANGELAVLIDPIQPLVRATEANGLVTLNPGLAAGQTLSIDFESFGGGQSVRATGARCAEARFRLFDDQGVLTWSSGDTCAGSGTNLPAGHWHLWVEGANRRSLDSAGVQLEGSVAADFLVEGSNNMPAFNQGSSTEKFLDLTASTFVQIRANDLQNNCAVNLFMAVYRDAGGPAVVTDDSIGPGDVCAEIRQRLDAGRYRVVVSGGNGIGYDAFRLAVTLD